MVLDADAEWYLGVSLNLTGSITINLGTNLLKLAYTREAENLVKQSKGNPTPVKLKDRSRTWFIGMIIFVIGNILNFVSFAFAAQSLLAALEPAFVSNVIFGKVLLGEPVSRKVVWSTSLIIFGNIIVVFFANHESRSYTTDDLINLYGNPAYIVYLVLGGIVCICGSIVNNYITKLEEEDRLPRRFSSAPAIMYALISGLLGTQSVIFAKALSNIVILTFQGENQLTNGFSYVVLICWLFSMIFWLRRMNNALIIFPGNRIIPVLQVVWILFGVISGGIYYQEFNEFSSLQIFMFTLGIIFVIIGVTYLAPSQEGAILSSGHSVHRRGSVLSMSAMFDVVGSSDCAGSEHENTKRGSKRRSLEMVVLPESESMISETVVSVPVVNQLNLDKVFQ